ncbi:adenylosuccinate synthase [Mesorhizobium sp. USDA 4775]
MNGTIWRIMYLFCLQFLRRSPFFNWRAILRDMGGYMRLVIVLSGPIGVGKSCFGEQLQALFGAMRVSTSNWIVEHRGVERERGALQAAGDSLDIETGGAWVADAVTEKASSMGDEAILLVDSARIAAQVEKLRERFGDRVFHVHLHAEDILLEQRYLARDPAHKEFTTYAEVRANGTEAAVGSLAEIADLVMDADYADARTLAVSAMAFRGVTAPQPQRLVDVIIGGQYGSEGKGNICAHLANSYGVLMRIGGPNAGHLVKDPPYKYVQLPSGTGTNKGAAILIGAGSTLWLPQLMLEIMEQGLTPDRLSIDSQAMVIDDEDRRIEDALTSIASTKQGVGSATARKIVNRGKVAVFGPPVKLARDVPQLAKFVRDVRAELDRHFAAGTRVLLEGTQGTLLSVHHGFWPSVTSRETSAAGCLSDAGIAPALVRRVILVLRTYPIRVGGNSGWMGREIEMEVVAQRSGIPIDEFLRVEKGTISGNKRRMAEFDWAQLRRSAVLNGATDVAVTFADYLGTDNRAATSFDELNEQTRTFIERVERVAGAPVTLVSKEFALDGVLEKGFKRD